jgi:hypothetical protein
MFITELSFYILVWGKVNGDVNRKRFDFSWSRKVLDGFVRNDGKNGAVQVSL